MVRFNNPFVAKGQCNNPIVAPKQIMEVVEITRPKRDFLMNKTAIMDLGFSRFRHAESETACQNRRRIGGPTLLFD
jgi:hypothetical protein